MSVHRLDSGTLRKPTKLKNGWLRADGYLARTGVQTYRFPDGSVRRELRKPEEVFSKDALDSFRSLPITDDHPTVMLDAKNTRQFQRGHNSDNVRQDGNFVRSELMVTDAELIEKMDNGKKQISCGYVCELDFTPGEWQGEKYDAVQFNIRGNHVAIVDVGRAGPQASVRMDAGEMVSPDELPTGDTTGGAVPLQKEKPMKTVKIDGVDYEVSEQAAQAIAKVLAKLDSDVSNHKKLADKRKEDLSAAEAKRDAALEELATLKKERTDAEDPAKIQERVDARVALLESARKFLGKDADLAGKMDRDIKLEVLKEHTKKDFSDKDDVYVDGRFDAAVEAAPEAPRTGIDKMRGATKLDEENVRKDEAQLGAERNKALRELGSKPLTQNGVR